MGKWERKKYEIKRVNPGSLASYYEELQNTKLRDGEEDVAKEIT